jgi:hypothetical protein
MAELDQVHTEQFEHEDAALAQARQIFLDRKYHTVSLNDGQRTFFGGRLWRLLEPKDFLLWCICADHVAGRLNPPLRYFASATELAGAEHRESIVSAAYHAAHTHDLVPLDRLTRALFLSICSRGHLPSGTEQERRIAILNKAVTQYRDLAGAACIFPARISDERQPPSANTWMEFQLSTKARFDAHIDELEEAFHAWAAEHQDPEQWSDFGDLISTLITI